MPDKTNDKIKKMSFMVKTFQIERFIYLFLHSARASYQLYVLQS